MEDSESASQVESDKKQKRKLDDLKPPTSIGLSINQQATVRPLLRKAFASWEADTLSIAELTDNKPLSVLALFFFEQSSLMSYFQLDPVKLERFLVEIESGYSDANPYHNRSHAASVLHFMHCLLVHGGVAKATETVFPQVDDFERRQRLVLLSGLLAAIVHDFEHEGVNNDYLVKSFSAKALQYNDRSPNENHHCASAFKVLFQPECNFLGGLSNQEFRSVRSLVMELVLATDMAESSNVLKAFKDVIGDGTSLPAATPQGSSLALKMALKCADLGHLALEWSLHMRWVRRLETEFYAQGDQEQKSNFPEISFLMDRNKAGVSESQVGFFNFVVLPLFSSLKAGFADTAPMLEAVEANYKLWHEIGVGTQAC